MQVGNSSGGDTPHYAHQQMNENCSPNIPVRASNRDVRFTQKKMGGSVPVDPMRTIAILLNFADQKLSE